MIIPLWVCLSDKPPPASPIDTRPAQAHDRGNRSPMLEGRIMSQEWTPPDDKTIARIRAMVRSDIEEGEPVGKLVDELVTEDGWPKEAAVSFVDQVEREGRARRKLRKTSGYPRGRAAPMADAPLQDHIDWYQDQGFQVVSQADTSAELVRSKQFSIFLALLSFMFFGIGLVLYLIYHLSGRNITVHLAVQPDGTVTAT